MIQSKAQTRGIYKVLLISQQNIAVVGRHGRYGYHAWLKATKYADNLLSTVDSFCFQRPENVPIPDAEYSKIKFILMISICLFRTISLFRTSDQNGISISQIPKTQKLSELRLYFHMIHAVQTYIACLVIWKIYRPNKKKKRESHFFFLLLLHIKKLLEGTRGLST